jgi:50S ribosomal subunit-associated GTPase HflX
MDAPELLVFNQIDKVPPGVGAALALRHRGVAVSALNRTGLGTLLERAEQMLWSADDERTLLHDDLPPRLFDPK